MNSSRSSHRPKVIVSDFDGTMTEHDFYKLALESLLPPGIPDYWAEYRDGRITHFEALRRYFAAIHASEDEVMAIVRQMHLDSGLSAAVQQLNRAGWKVVIASAGCEWYIRRLLDSAGVTIEIHSNPGQLKSGQGLLMELPTGSPFFSETLGINKTAIVRKHLSDGAVVAFAGDGFPDADPARLVPEELRFARGDLAGVLEAEGLRFHRFSVWSEIAPTLLEGGIAEC